MHRCSLYLVMIVLCHPLLAEEPTSPGFVKQRPPSGRYVKIDGGYMVPYQVEIPGTDQTIWMEPIPGGEFVMGSPEVESGRKKIEGPQSRWKTAPFWMGRYEITQAQFKPFMGLYSVFQDYEFQSMVQLEDGSFAEQHDAVDAVTAPTLLYEPDFHFEYGRQNDMPMVTVTQYSAKQYTKWLSAVTGVHFRLPTEAEWEYSCRAGTDTRYHFGDDAQQLSEYAWFESNSFDDGHRVVGQKKPNPWGLYDMHGNVAEWVADQCLPYEQVQTVRDAQHDFVVVEKIDPIAVRGGSFYATADQCRSASRLASDHDDWREHDPDLPKSPWWLSSDVARSIGMRIVRPLQPLSGKDQITFWGVGNRDTFHDVHDRVQEGRGALGRVSAELMTAIAERQARRKAEQEAKMKHAAEVRKRQQKPQK